MSEYPLLETQARLIEAEDGWYAYLINDVIVPVTDWFDEDGDPCDPLEAKYCVAGADGYGWLTIELHSMVDKEMLN